ncbi:chorion class B protein PC10-like [Aricia agestis]|uniref:chorion class B protein PC10-like n=1 Tax=Aricia agestis TaxID=91739 RepID=UPI001C207ACE|nr:chorion class B protein PC10-like [Aricia agestis]
MVAKAVLILCAQALLIQSISAQCLGAYPALAAAPCAAAAPLAAAPCGAGYAGFGYAAPAPAQALAASNGPGLAISSASPISPVGVSVASENAIEGALAVAGALPFLGTVGLEGVLPTAGAGNVAYNCGNGAVAITAEDIAAAPFGYAAAGPLGYGAAGLGWEGAGFGYGAGLGYGPGLGYGAGYGGCGCGAALL